MKFEIEISEDELRDLFYKKLCEIIENAINDNVSWSDETARFIRRKIKDDIDEITRDNKQLIIDKTIERYLEKLTSTKVLNSVKSEIVSRILENDND